jgi:hypothetical protein
MEPALLDTDTLSEMRCQRSEVLPLMRPGRHHYALYALPAIMVECFARMAEGGTGYVGNVDSTQQH